MSERRRDDPEVRFLRLLGIILLAAIVLWATAIKLGFWPYLLVFAVVCFVALRIWAWRNK